MEKSYTIYTALFGDYDTLNELPFRSAHCRYLCFTDQAILSNSWEIIKIRCDETTPILMNRKIKMLPHKYLDKTSGSIYIDANIKVNGDLFPLFNKYLHSALISFPKHYERHCIYDEITACLQQGKINSASGLSWTRYLQSQGFPRQYGLGENNILVRYHNDSRCIALMECWWELFKNRIQRDQLSLMYLIWKLGINYNYMNETSRNKNKFFQYCLHRTNVNFLRKFSRYIDARKNSHFLYGLCSNIKHKIKKGVR